jgi:hypothetical protein
MVSTENRKKSATGMETRLLVSRTVFGQESAEAEHIEVRPFATVPAMVGVKLGRTVNLGNFESARIDVSLEVPCYREEILRMYPALFNHVSERLSEEVSKIAGNSEKSLEEIL